MRYLAGNELNAKPSLMSAIFESITGDVQLNLLLMEVSRGMLDPKIDDIGLRFL